MSIDRLDLCSLDDVISYPGMETIPEKNLLWVVRLIRGISMRAQQHTDRLFLSKARTRPLSSQRDSCVIGLPAYGSSDSAVAEIRESSGRDFASALTLVDSDDYFFDTATGLVHREGYWLNGRGVIQATWTGGIAINTEGVPDDLRQAAVIQVAFWWQRYKDLGVSGKSFDQGGSVSISSPLTLLPEVVEVFDTYSRAAI